MNMEQFVQYSGYAVAALTALISIYKAYKQGKNAGEIITILVNTLKDESKMTGGKFSPEAVKKAEEVAITIGANNKAVEEAKKALGGAEIDVKIGSYKGKPIYLSEAIGAGAIIKKLKKIF